MGMNTKIKKISTFGTLFSIAIILPLIAISKNYLFFQNNDDLFIMGRASGMFYGEPSSELIYISPPLSWLLKILYSISGEWSWYTFALIFTQFLAVLIYLYLFQGVIQNAPSGRGFLITVIISLPVFVMFILFYSLQFTQTSIMATGIGVLAYLFGDTRVKKIFGLLLVALGILWRSDASIVVIAYVVGITVIFYLIKHKKINIKNFSKKLIPLFSVTLLSYAAYFVTFNDWTPWIDVEKREYVALKNVFTQLYGFESTATSYQDLKKPAKDVGWSDNDWNLYQSYYFADSEVFSVEKQSEIADMRIQQSYPSFAVAVAKNLMNIFKKYETMLLITFLFTLLLLVFLNQNRAFLLVSFWAFTLVTYYFILFFGERLPDRVFWPFIFLNLTTFAVVIILSYREEFDLPSFQSKYFQPAAALAITVLISGVFLNIFRDYQNKIHQEQWWKSAAQQQVLNIDKVYNFESDKPIMTFFSFYENFRKTIDPIKGPDHLPKIWDQMILIGWENRTPEFNKRLRANGLTEDIFTSVAFGDAYLATWTNPEDNFEAGRTSIFLREHKNIEIIWETTPFVFSDAGFTIWRAEDFLVIK
jgi:hypothetical protein